MTPQEQLELVNLVRSVQWRFKLDSFETAALKRLLSALDQANSEILTMITARAETLPEWREERALALLDEYSDLQLTLKSQLGQSIAEITGVAGANSYIVHNDILSFGGLVKDFNNVSLTAEQLRQMAQKMPIGGRLLSEWVESAFDTSFVRQEIMTGMLKGEGYPALARRLLQQWDMTKQDAITITRTYVASVNVFAAEDVYRANKDVVKALRWTAAMEPGYSKSGRGTCLRCAALDGQEYKMEEKHPDCPLHPRCRCFLLPVTRSWKELGIPVEEIEKAARPFTIRPDKNIDAGGRRTIEEVGFHDGDYASWFKTRDKGFQLNVVGPGRYKLLQDGKVQFNDFVDKNGNLRTIKELMAL